MFICYNKIYICEAWNFEFQNSKLHKTVSNKNSEKENGQKEVLRTYGSR